MKKVIICVFVGVMLVSFGLATHHRNRAEAQAMPSTEMYSKDKNAINMDRKIELLMAYLSARLPYGVRLHKGLAIEIER